MTPESSRNGSREDNLLLIETEDPLQRQLSSAAKWMGLFYEEIKSGMNFNGGKGARYFLSPGAVSYTHLDVYKRQLGPRPNSPGASFNSNGTGRISLRTSTIVLKNVFIQF